MPRNGAMVMSAQIATANRLLDGAVVFLGYDGQWTRAIDEARVAERDDDIAELQAEATASEECVGAYLIDVDVRSAEVSGRFIRPTKYRERIRAFGPTTHPSFATKLVPEHFEMRADVSTAFAAGI